MCYLIGHEHLIAIACTELVHNVHTHNSAYNVFCTVHSPCIIMHAYTSMDKFSNCY